MTSRAKALMKLWEIMPQDTYLLLCQYAGIDSHITDILTYVRTQGRAPGLSPDSTTPQLTKQNENQLQ